MIGGKVVDPSALVAYVRGSVAMDSWLAVAKELSTDPGRLQRIAPDLDVDLL